MTSHCHTVLLWPALRHVAFTASPLRNDVPIVWREEEEPNSLNRVLQFCFSLILQVIHFKSTTENFSSHGRKWVCGFDFWNKLMELFLVVTT